MKKYDVFITGCKDCIYFSRYQSDWSLFFCTHKDAPELLNGKRDSGLADVIMFSDMITLDCPLEDV